MKTTILCLLALTVVARADLGDSYAISCQRFGNPWRVDRQYQFIFWGMGNGDLIGEQFLHNQCVCFLYLSTYRGGGGYTEQSIRYWLSRNARVDQTWYQNREQAGLGWVTNDGRIYGKEFVFRTTLMFRVAYTSWLKRHGMLYLPPAPSERPPVEEQVPSKPKPKPRPKPAPELPPIEEAV